MSVKGRRWTHYTLYLEFRCYHADRGTWRVARANHGLLAPSRRAALNRGLKVIESWQIATDYRAAGIDDYETEARIVSEFAR